MIENHLSGMKARSGAVMFVCSTCKVAPNFLFGAEADGELVYLLICPKCEIGLAEWKSMDARDLELREFARNWRLRH
jgi:hypothetical protein